MSFSEKSCNFCKHYQRIPLSDHRPTLVDNFCDIDNHKIMSWDVCEYTTCENWEKEGDGE